MKSDIRLPFALRAFAAVAWMMLAVSVAFGADLVYFNDGRTLIGEVLQETPEEVEAKGTIDGVEIHSTFKRSQIASVLRNVSSPSSTKVEKVAADAESKGDFLIVPIKGEFGKDVFPLGLITSMEWAVKHKVPRIVMVIDSPGGQVWAAKEMADQMKEQYDKLRFTMVIQNAISASIWPTFASDDLYIAPGGTFGGAVVYTVTGTGSAQVDEKMNSILAAEVATMAERKGHSGALARAMMLPGQQVWAVPGVTGNWILSAERPDDANRSKAKQLNVGEIFTLTSEDCVKYGIAGTISGTGESDIAHALGDLKSAGNQGAASMKNAKTSCEGLVKQYKTWIQNLRDAAEKLQDTAKTTNDREAVIRKIDELTSTYTNRIGTLKEKAKQLHMLPVVAAMENEDAAEVRKRIEKIKAKIRGH
jgi:hypothetical protein